MPHFQARTDWARPAPSALIHFEWGRFFGEWPFRQFATRLAGIARSMDSPSGIFKAGLIRIDILVSPANFQLAISSFQQILLMEKINGGSLCLTSSFLHVAPKQCFHCGYPPEGELQQVGWSGSDPQQAFKFWRVLLVGYLTELANALSLKLDSSLSLHF